MRWRLGHWCESTDNTALGQAVPVCLSLGEKESYTATPMSRDLEPKYDHLWKEYTDVFMEMDDLTLARWMAQTLGQFAGRVWRLSHPLLLTYELAARAAHDRQIWLKGMGIVPADYIPAECCRAPLFPVLSRDVAEVGLVCKHCGEACVHPEDLPVEMKSSLIEWAEKYEKVHSVAHWEEDGIKLPHDYDRQLEKAAIKAEKYLLENGDKLALDLLDYYPAVAWEDQDECLAVRPEDLCVK
jgi:hypothetical protein